MLKGYFVGIIFENLKKIFPGYWIIFLCITFFLSFIYFQEIIDLHKILKYGYIGLHLVISDNL